jgi:ABC-type sulfate transport system substrate-binding protein
VAHRWTCLAAWGYAEGKATKVATKATTKEAARGCERSGGTQVRATALSQRSGTGLRRPRASTVTFVERGLGGVLHLLGERSLSWPRDRELGPDKFDIIVPYGQHPGRASV